MMPRFISKVGHPRLVEDTQSQLEGVRWWKEKQLFPIYIFYYLYKKLAGCLDLPLRIPGGSTLSVHAAPSTSFMHSSPFPPGCPIFSFSTHVAAQRRAH